MQPDVDARGRELGLFRPLCYNVKAFTEHSPRGFASMVVVVVGHIGEGGGRVQQGKDFDH